jgi:hypothetical protein
VYNGRRIGIIQTATIRKDTDQLIIDARLDTANCVDEIAAIKDDLSALAYAYEIVDVRVVDEKAEVWEISHCHFAGVALKPAAELA